MESESKTYTMESLDTGIVGQPPNVTFNFRDDMHSMWAEPEHARIEIEKIGDVHSLLTIENNGEKVADLVVRHCPASEPQWECQVSYYCEIACAMYWSFWRGQERKRLMGGE